VIRRVYFSSRFKFIRITLLVSASLLGSSTAIAQEAAASIGLKGADAETIAEQANQSSEASGGNEGEIVVTALKRATNIQDTPLSISAIGAKTLTNMGITDSTQLARSTPSLVFRENGNGPGTRVIIRNIQSSGEPVVGVYYDETPVVGSAGVSNDAGGSSPEIRLFDVERVEVLRGPQGTLYGSGSMAGTLRLIFNKPNMNETQGGVAGQVSTTAHGGPGYETQGFINLPLIEDKLAVRAVGFYRDRDGYLDNSRLGLKNFNDTTSKGGRLMVRFKPTSDITFDGLAVIQDTDTFHSNWFFPTYASGGQPYDASYESVQPQKDNLHLYSGTLNWDLGGAILTGVASYSKRALEYNYDTSQYFRNASANATVNSAGCRNYAGSGTAACSSAQLGQYRQYALSMAPSTAYSPQDTKNSTQELRLSSSGKSALNWTVGAFHAVRKTGIVSDVNAVDPATGQMIVPLTTVPTVAGNVTRPATVLFRRVIEDELKQVAFFGEVGYAITSRLNVTAGGRYFDYSKTVTGSVTVPNIVIGNGLEPPTTSKASENGWVFKFSADYHLTDDVMLYAQAAQGFRPGGVNQVIGLPSALGPYTSDSLWNYEGGIKSSWFDRGLILNVDVFQVDWSDIQSSAQTSNAQANGSTFSFITNAGNVRIRGIELESTIRPLRGLILQASGSYIEAKLTEDQRPVNGITIAGAGLKGDFVPNTPKITAQASAQYTYLLADNIELLTRADMNYVSSAWNLYQRTNAFQQRLPGYATVGLRAGVQAENGDWGISLFANNLFDKVGLSTKGNGALFGGGNNVRTVSIAPRTIGIDFRKNF
jgi:iron complex outermembrane receptor protein